MNLFHESAASLPLLPALRLILPAAFALATFLPRAREKEVLSQERRWHLFPVRATRSLLRHHTVPGPGSVVRGSFG